MISLFPIFLILESMGEHYCISGKFDGGKFGELILFEHLAK